MEYNYDKFIKSKFAKDLSYQQLIKLKELFDSVGVINSNKIKIVIDFIEYDVDGSWKDRFEKINNFYKRDGISLDSLRCRYGDIIGYKLFVERKEKYVVTKDKYEKIHGKNSWEKLNKKKSSIGKEKFISKYGKEIGIQKWNEYLKKWKNSIKIKKESGTWKENSTLDSYIQKYGNIEGIKKWNLRISKFKYSNSKSGYIKKYGNIEGKKKWKLYCENRSITLEKMKKLYGNKEGENRYKDWKIKCLKNNRLGKTYSKVSQVLFWKIYESLNNNLQKHCKFAELNEEETLYLNGLKKSIKLDFKLNNNIIEFDGDYWHSSLKAKKRDCERDIELKKYGYKILRISEKDFNKNQQKIINTCLTFLGKYNDNK